MMTLVGLFNYTHACRTDTFLKHAYPVIVSLAAYRRTNDTLLQTYPALDILRNCGIKEVQTDEW